LGKVLRRAGPVSVLEVGFVPDFPDADLVAEIGGEVLDQLSPQRVVFWLHSIADRASVAFDGIVIGSGGEFDRALRNLTHERDAFGAQRFGVFFPQSVDVVGRYARLVAGSDLDGAETRRPEIQSRPACAEQSMAFRQGLWTVREILVVPDVRRKEDSPRRRRV